jgi:hypothetical protein
MGLPEADWLAKAQQQAIGQSGRYQHGYEKRQNLIVSNHSDRWQAYCQSCKMGGVRMKDHVRMLDVKPPSASAFTTLPPDLKRLCEHDKEVQLQVHRFLIRKKMDACMLPELSLSLSRMRLVMTIGNAVLGRDITDKSNQKWMTYNGNTRYLEAPVSNNQLWPGEHQACQHDGPDGGVVVEDPFSFCKLEWALRQCGYSGRVRVFSSLGTALSQCLVLRLLATVPRCGILYDGDDAGYKGAARGVQRLGACGMQAKAACAPQGLDPKDLECGQLVDLALAALAT